MSLPSLNQPFVIGTSPTALGPVPRISCQMTRSDLWGTVKARWGVGRMSYTVDPGLYAIGTPDSESPVLATSNYKMTFDVLRQSLQDISAWILVVDTQGINVWCAAGKGTFGTDELVRRIETARLSEIVWHRRIILPQLAAPGVAAHEVRRRSGFRVLYGPIRAEDIRQYLAQGCQAGPEMRRKTFGLKERIVLIPVELVGACKTALLALPLFFLLGGLAGQGSFLKEGSATALFAAIALGAAILAGAVLTPILLPWLPGRAFSLKGVVPGLVAAGLVAFIRLSWWGPMPAMLEIVGWGLLTVAAATYAAMNFTGASTYTSLSGVKKEMRVAVPLQIVAALTGVILWAGSVMLA